MGVSRSRRRPCGGKGGRWGKKGGRVRFGGERKRGERWQGKMVVFRAECEGGKRAKETGFSAGQRVFSGAAARRLTGRWGKKRRKKQGRGKTAKERALFLFWGLIQRGGRFNFGAGSAGFCFLVECSGGRRAVGEKRWCSGRSAKGKRGEGRGKRESKFPGWMARREKGKKTAGWRGDYSEFLGAMGEEKEKKKQGRGGEKGEWEEGKEKSPVGWRGGKKKEREPPQEGGSSFCLSITCVPFLLRWRIRVRIIPTTIGR